MATGENGGRKVLTTAERYRELLSDDPKLALELALAENDRAKSRISESKTISLSEDGRMIATSLEGLQTIGAFFANTQLVPERFRGKPNDCAVGVHMAMRMRVDPLLMLQSLYVVHGTPGLEAKLVIALLNASPKIKGRVRYELSGDFENRKCVASAVDAETGEIHSATVDMDMARGEGWLKNTKWTSLRDLMLTYRSASFLGRTCFPDITMGLHTIDELQDAHGDYIDGEVVKRESSGEDMSIVETDDDPLESAVSASASKTADSDKKVNSSAKSETKKETTVATESFVSDASEQSESGAEDDDDAEFQEAADVEAASEKKAEDVKSAKQQDLLKGETTVLSRWIAKIANVQTSGGADKALQAAFRETDMWTDADIKLLTETTLAVKKRLSVR